MQLAKRVKLIFAKNEDVQQYGGALPEDEGIITSEVEQKKTDKIKSKIYDKIHRFIKVILKLARYVGYDDDLRIKLKNGKYFEKSNIVDLLTHAVSVGKVLYGESEFIELLLTSGVDPDLIINDNVRNKLIQIKNKGKQYKIYNDDDDVFERTQRIKRKHEDSDDENERKRHKPIDGDNEDSEMESEKIFSRKKRKHDSDIEDDQIDEDRWEIPK